MKKYCLYVLFFVLWLPQYAWGQKPYPNIFQKQWQIEIIPFDIPHQLSVAQTYGGNFFSSYQSLSIPQSQAIYSGINNLFYSTYYGLFVPKTAKFLYEKLKVPGWVSYTLLPPLSIVFSFYMYALPGGYYWADAEYIKAIATTHGVRMDNTIAHFRTDKLVNNISDRDLSRLQEKFPADFIRLYAVSSESYTMQDRRKNQNFFFSPKQDLLTSLFNTLPGFIVNLYFLFQNNTNLGRVDAEITKANRQESNVRERSLFGPLSGFSNISSRTAWTYALFNRHKPYNSRGVHPLGEGINRYILYAQLSTSERDYLNKVTRLNWLNLVSPFNIGIQQIPLGSDWVGNFAINYGLTPFGTDMSIDIYLKKTKKRQFIFTYHNYQNYKYTFPGFQAQLLNYPLSDKNGQRIYISPNILLGWQPKAQLFIDKEDGTTNSKQAQLFFNSSIRIGADLTKKKWLLPYVDLGYKTEGWMPENPYIQKNFYGRVGMLFAW